MRGCCLSSYFVFSCNLQQPCWCPVHHWGSKNDGNGFHLIDTETDPWAKQPAEVKKPKQAEHVKPEIIPRAALFGMKQPWPGQWNVEKCFEWLNENLVMDVECRMFLLKEAARLNKILTDAIQEKVAVLASTIRLSRVWSGPNPYLRLLHCIIEDDICPHYCGGSLKFFWLRSAFLAPV